MQKAGHAAYTCQVTDVRLQLPELVWELEPRTGSGKAGDGTGLCSPGLEKMEEADSPIRAPSGAQHHQLCWELKQRRGMRGHSQCKERNNHCQGPAHKNKPSIWLSWEKPLKHLMLLCFGKELPTLVIYFVSVLFCKSARHPCKLCKWITWALWESESLAAFGSSDRYFLIAKPLKVEPRCR